MLAGGGGLFWPCFRCARQDFQHCTLSIVCKTFSCIPAKGLLALRKQASCASTAQKPACASLARWAVILSLLGRVSPQMPMKNTPGNFPAGKFPGVTIQAEWNPIPTTDRPADLQHNLTVAQPNAPCVQCRSRPVGPSD